MRECIKVKKKERFFGAYIFRCYVAKFTVTGRSVIRDENGSSKGFLWIKRMIRTSKYMVRLCVLKKFMLVIFT